MADKYVIFGATYDGDGTSTTEATGATVTITIASPGVVTWNTHGLAANTVVYLETTGALPTGLNGTTTYYVRNPGTNTFELSATSGGASINTSGTQSGTHYCSTAGAWRATNSTGATLTALQGTISHGVLAAGDIVYIRSKTGAGADLDITYTLPAAINLGSTVPTASTEPIKWILDGGTKWSGVNGTMTMKRTASYQTVFRGYNWFVAENEDKWVHAEEYSSVSGGVPFSIAVGSLLKNIWFDLDNVPFSANGPSAIYCGEGPSTLINPRITVGNKWYGYIIGANNYASFKLINPRIELSTAITTDALFATGLYGSSFQVFGGSISGQVAGVKVVLPGASSMVHRFFGTDIPKTMVMIHTAPTSAQTEHMVEAIGLDLGLGAMKNTRAGYIDSRTDGNYPTLNAYYPDSGSTKWSWKIYPINTWPAHIMEIPMMKVFTDTAATKTITVELEVGDAFVGTTYRKVNKGSVWIDVCYVDSATGALKYQSTFSQNDTAQLTTSTASWSATTYGSIALVKQKLEITTSTSIKKDTMVIVTLRSIARSTSSDDVIFVDPDPQLT